MLRPQLLRILGEPAIALSSLFVEVSEHIAPLATSHQRQIRFAVIAYLLAVIGKVNDSRVAAFNRSLGERHVCRRPSGAGRQWRSC
jgi:hypothetical protein